MMKAHTNPKGKVAVTLERLWEIAKKAKDLPYITAPYSMSEAEFRSQNQMNSVIYLDAEPTWAQLQEGIFHRRTRLLRFF